MQDAPTTQADRLITLIKGAVNPPPGRWRIVVAYTYGFFCHALFGLAVLSMIVGMFFGMSESFGRLPAPWSYVVNAFLLLQFPIAHSLLLTRRGSQALKALAPEPHAGTLATTTFATVASVQLLLLYLLWTPSGVIWWRAEGLTFALLCVAYAASYLMLIKASYDAGPEVQSGALGWMSLAGKRAPKFPDMPTTGLFKIIRQPIYVSFALTTWTVPVWTPDQLAVAITFTAYCLLAPLMKGRRFAKRYGDTFETYKKHVPYALPRLRSHSHDDTPQQP